MARVRTQADNGVKTNIDYVSTSAGAADADKFVITNPSGLIDSTLLPPGAGATAISLEAIPAGSPVNVFDSAGNERLQLANANDSSKPCVGISENGGSVGASIEYTPLSHKVSTPLATIASTDYWLGLTSGSIVTTTATFVAGNVVQKLGRSSVVGEMNTISEDIEVIA